MDRQNVHILNIENELLKSKQLELILKDTERKLTTALEDSSRLRKLLEDRTKELNLQREETRKLEPLKDERVGLLEKIQQLENALNGKQ